MTDGTGPPLMQRAPNAFIWRRTTVDSHSSGYPLRHGTPHGMILPRWTRTRTLSRDGTCGSSLTGGARETNTQYSRPTRSRSTTKRTQRSTSRRPPPRIRVSWPRTFVIASCCGWRNCAGTSWCRAYADTSGEMRCRSTCKCAHTRPPPRGAALRECIEISGRSFPWELPKLPTRNLPTRKLPKPPARKPPPQKLPKLPARKLPGRKLPNARVCRRSTRRSVRRRCVRCSGERG